VEAIVLDLARERGLSLGTAESCTGGLIAARLTSVPGSSDVLRGGIVAYDNEVKVERLAFRARCSALTARSLPRLPRRWRRALGTRSAPTWRWRTQASQGPGGVLRRKPVGLVYVHALGPEGEAARELQLPGDREAVRVRATAAALHLLRSLLTHTRHTDA
jgi:nicotinamide mononucleotide (NMN) deamidase PncC